MTSCSSFDRSALPPARTFYEDECGKLSRPSRGWARARCPIHGGDNPTAFSVNLENGGFFCHACGAKGGDLVAYVMQRDKLDFPSACKQLGAWRNIAPAEQEEFRQHQCERERERAKEAAKKKQERQERIRARDWLHFLEREYARTVPSTELGWQYLSNLLPLIRDAEAEYFRLAGLEVTL